MASIRISWKTFLTPWTEISNPKGFQYYVHNDTFYLEKYWGWFIHSPLRYHCNTGNIRNFLREPSWSMEDITDSKDDVNKLFWVHQWICHAKYLQFDVYHFSLSSQWKKIDLASIRNLWRRFLTPWMEIRNPKGFQYDVPDHSFHLEKDWGWFLHLALRY